MTTDPAGTVVVLTALDTEYEAVRALLRDPSRHRHPAGTLFEVGGLYEQSGQVALAVIGAGNLGAAALTERAITEFRPRAVLFVGIAGALHDDLDLGTVVVATKVYSYHGGTDETGGFRVRPQAWDADHELDQLAREVHRTGAWKQLLGAAPAPPTVQFRPIAAGEVVLNSQDTPLAAQLRTAYDDAAAIEMESAGIARAAHLNRAPFLTIRGISDKADGRKYSADRAGWQANAAANAAAFAITVARSILAADTTDRTALLPSGESSVPPSGKGAKLTMTIMAAMYSNASPPKRRAIRLLGTVVGLTLIGFVAIWLPFPPQQPPTVEKNENARESGTISGLPAPNVSCLRGCRDLQLSEGQDFDIEAWRTADDTSNDIAVGNNYLQDYMLRPLNGAGIQPIPNMPAGALDAADCPTGGGYSTDMIPIPPTIPFCLLTAKGTRVMLMGQDAFNLPFRPFLTSTLPPEAIATRVGIRPQSGPAGTVVMLNAYGFLIGEPVDVQAVTQSGRTFPLGSRTANADGDVRGLPIEVDKSICCAGSAIKIRTTGRLSKLTAEIPFSIV